MIIALFYWCKVPEDGDFSETFRSKFTLKYTIYRGADKSLARPTSRCILFDGENISFDASLVIYIYIYTHIYIYIYIHTYIYI